MAFLGFGKKQDAVKQTVTDHDDGSQTVKTEFVLEGEPRPVNDDVVAALDGALGRLGGQVMHAMDPSRLLGFAHGGPPVWSIGVVDVPGPRPYTLLVTYGFSHVLSPEECREGLAHEYSFAVPAGTQFSPWAEALLRHQCRYVLNQGADIKVNDCVPFRGVPMTRLPFQPEHHAKMPDSTLVGLLATADPVLGTVATAQGPIEVRRLVCIDAQELDCAETWSPKGFLEELKKADPLLLSAITRPSHLANPAFRAQVERRAAAEGSDVDAALFELRWEPSGKGAIVHLPKGPAAKRLLDGLTHRVGFGRRLLAFSMRSPPVVFLPGPAEVRPTPRALELQGDLETGPIGAVVTALRQGAATVSF